MCWNANFSKHLLILNVIDYALFIKSIKKQNPQYLLKSKIYVYNRYIFRLAKYIFYVEKPVAPVELILINEDNTQSIQYFNP